jgi:hypothetical protein
MEALMRRLLALFARCVIWFMRIFLKVDRLKAIELIQLRDDIGTALAEYGEPNEKRVSEECPDATVYEFELFPFHRILLTVWNGSVHSASYESAYHHPKEDLKTMLDFYGEGVDWRVLSAGYSYLRCDRDRMVFCSAMPLLGCATKEFLDAERAYKESKKGQANLGPHQDECR